VLVFGKEKKAMNCQSLASRDKEEKNNIQSSSENHMVTIGQECKKIAND